MQNKPRVLILTYYWPPAGGSGVQRWLKFAKYLGDYGWDLVVYTASNPEAPAYDPTLLRDVPPQAKVVKRMCIEPHGLFRLLTGSREGLGAGFASGGKTKSSLIYRASMWLRANLFIPDARALWIGPSVRYLTKYLTTNPVDLVISTGPPHSMHLIALKLNERLGIKWIADFRDPWTNIDYFQALKLTPFALKKHFRLEKKVIATADCVVVVSSRMRDEFEQLSPKRIELITNGYDEMDFPSTPALDPDFSITHVGTLPANRNCTALWEALANLVKIDSEFASRLRLNLVGKVDTEVIRSIEELGLRKFCTLHGYLSHPEGVATMQRSRVLLLIVNDSANSSGILTGKVFEYLGAKRPIMALGPPHGDVDLFLAQTQAGRLFPFNDMEAILEGLKLYWHEYRKPSSPFMPTGGELYSRRVLAQRMSQLMNEMIGLNPFGVR